MRAASRRVAVAAGPTLVWPAKDAPVGVRAAVVPELIERLPASVGGPANRLYWGDNLDVLAALAAEMRGKIDLVYIDPPFATGSLFEFSAGARGSAVAYRDQWDDTSAYLSAMLVRLRAMRELLSERGSIFVHCDWRVSHWMRCLLDEVFGADCFKNEIVWRYRRWPSKTRILQRMHDVIFWYGKSADDVHAFRAMYEPLAASTLATFGTKKQVADFSSGRRKPSQLDVETLGAPLSDVWDVGIIAPIARERVGYPTQKPEALLRRVIELCTRPGDLVADFFCGSGTTLAVAERLGRRWIGCDAGRIAIHTAKKRLLAMAVEQSPAGFDLHRCGTPEPGEPGPRVEPVLVHRYGETRVELPKGSGASQVDSWSIDVDVAVRRSRACSAHPFTHTWWSTRARRGESVELRSSALPSRAERVMVQLADVLGHTRVLELRRRA